MQIAWLQLKNFLTVLRFYSMELIQVSAIETHKYNWRIKNQLDATYYFIVLLIGSICFGHSNARNIWAYKKYNKIISDI